MIDYTGELTPDKMCITCQPSTRGDRPSTVRPEANRRPKTQHSKTDDPQPRGGPFPRTHRLYLLADCCCARLSQSKQQYPFYHQGANQLMENSGMHPGCPLTTTGISSTCSIWCRSITVLRQQHQRCYHSNPQPKPPELC